MNTQRARPGARRRRGAAAVEFALTLPVFVAVLFAVMDYGQLFYEQSRLDRAVTAGCRAASLIDPGDDNGNMGQLVAVAEREMLQSLGYTDALSCPSGCSVQVTDVGSPPGRSIICIAHWRFRPVVGAVVDPMNMHSNVATRMEWQRWP